MNGFITIHKKIKLWGWYKKSEMVHLFLHLLISANYKDGEWMGNQVKRGQLITGRKSLSDETGLTERTIRTCLNRLKATNEVTIKTTSKYSLITILKYDDYQDQNKKTTSKATNKRPTSDQQTTTTNNKEQYKQWLDKTSNDKYKSFINWFLNENCEQCLKLNDHLTEDKFVTLITKHTPEKIKITISSMENKADLTKRYKSFSRTLTTWLNRD